MKSSASERRLRECAIRVSISIEHRMIEANLVKSGTCRSRIHNQHVRLKWRRVSFVLIFRRLIWIIFCTHVYPPQSFGFRHCIPYFEY